MFINAHLPAIDRERLADALVHEAIHSLLYMHETREPWIVDDRSVPRDAALESPWSGARLTVRNFLQACFVWFGLAHFWARVEDGLSFRPDRVKEHAATARRGFLAGPLDRQLASYSNAIAPPLLEMMRKMQANITASAVKHGTAAAAG
jgi:hypothetical protein